MESILKNYTEELTLRAKNIKAIVVDVDGVLTDGGIIYDNGGNEFKKFNVKDGQVVKHLKNEGILLGAITGRDSDVVRRRCSELRFDFHHHGVKDKIALYETVKNEYQLNDEEILYIGDDIIDLGILARCGLGVCPSDAKPYVQEHASFVCEAKGGNGVLREVADFVLAAKGAWDKILKSYLP